MRSFPSKLTVTLCFILSTFFFVTLTLGHKPQSEQIAVKVVILPFLANAPFFIADAEGFFKEQGIDVEFVRMKRTATAVSSLIRGKIDVMSGAIWPGHLNAIARGARIKFVANKSYLGNTGCISTAIVVRRALVESGELVGPEHLRGLKISLNVSSYKGFFLEKLLRSAEMSLDDVEMVDLLPSVECEALQRGTIDIAVLSEPWLTWMNDSSDVSLWMDLREVVPEFQWGFILYGPTLLNENPEAGERFMVAYLKGVRQYYRGKTERNVDILTDYTDLDRELLQKACWPALRIDGRINVEEVNTYQTWAFKKGLLDRTVSEEEFWDPRFVEYASRVFDGNKH